MLLQDLYNQYRIFKERSILTEQIEQFFTNLNFMNQTAILTVPDILAALIISFLLSLLIFFVYIKTFKGVMHSSSFAISLIAMTLITTLVILAVAQHFIIAIGMVGALSIVRFRTIVKEPLDLVYLFWAISTGIIVGTGLVLLAVTGAFVISAILLLMSSHKVKETPYMVVINCTSGKIENDILTIIQKSTKKYTVKAKSASKNSLELTVEVRLKNESTEFINSLTKITGVSNATLVSYNGDYYI